MESILALLETLNSLSPLAVIALLGTVIFLLVKGKGDVDGKYTTITENHLHDLPDMVAALGRIETLMQNMNDNIIYIKARVNGGSK